MCKKSIFCLLFLHHRTFIKSFKLVLQLYLMFKCEIEMSAIPAPHAADAYRSQFDAQPETTHMIFMNQNLGQLSKNWYVVSVKMTKYLN